MINGYGKYIKAVGENASSPFFFLKKKKIYISAVNLVLFIHLRVGCCVLDAIGTTW